MPTINISGKPGFGSTQIVDESPTTNNIESKSDKTVNVDDLSSQTKTVETKDNRVVNMTTVLREVEVEWKLPFRVRFENIGIMSYNRDNVPPIGIAVIGLNNYII